MHVKGTLSTKRSARRLAPAPLGCSGDRLPGRVAGVGIPRLQHPQLVGRDVAADLWPRRCLPGRLLRSRRCRRACAGSACGTRSPPAGRRRSGSRPQPDAGASPRRRASGPPTAAPRCRGGAGARRPLRRPDLHQPAQVQHRDPVGQVAHHAEVVGDEQVGRRPRAAAGRPAGSGSPPAPTRRAPRSARRRPRSAGRRRRRGRSPRAA